MKNKYELLVMISKNDQLGIKYKSINHRDDVYTEYLVETDDWIYELDHMNVPFKARIYEDGDEESGCCIVAAGTGNGVVTHNLYNDQTGTFAISATDLDDSILNIKALTNAIFRVETYFNSACINKLVGIVKIGYTWRKAKANFTPEIEAELKLVAIKIALASMRKNKTGGLLAHKLSGDLGFTGRWWADIEADNEILPVDESNVPVDPVALDEEKAA